MAFKKFFNKFAVEKNTSAPEYIVCGLGNPGSQYESTRHNVGFMTIDRLCERESLQCKKIKFKSLVGNAVLSGKNVLLMKPSTFMNKSGEALVEAMNFYKIPPKKVILIFDDISLDVGKMRIRQKGSHGGQNGVKNIIYLTGKDDFPRIKIGIGNKPHPDYDLASWVLSHFKKEEGKVLEKVLDDAVSSVILMLEGKAQDAMNKYNS